MLNPARLSRRYIDFHRYVELYRSPLRRAKRAFVHTLIYFTPMSLALLAPY